MNAVRQSTPKLQDAGVSSVHIAQFTLIDLPASGVQLLHEMLQLLSPALPQAVAVEPSNPDAQLPITGVAERVVFLARPPQDIATSCWLRYSQPRDRTLASWARTVLFAERATRGMDRVVLEHAPLLADPALALRTLDPAAASYTDEQLRLLRPELINCTKRGESFTSDDVDFVDFTPFELLCNEIFDALLALVPGIETVSADDKTFDALYERYVELRATGSDRVGVDVDALSAAVQAVSEVQPVPAANVSSAAEQVLRQELASALGTLEAVYKSRQWWLGTKMVPLLDRVPPSVRSLPRRSRSLAKIVLRGGRTEEAVAVPGVAPKAVDQEIDRYDGARRYLDKVGDVVPTDPMSPSEAFIRAAGMADVIRGSTLFDQSEYCAMAGIDAATVDPVYHYLLDGEIRGLMPSRYFDPAYYIERYPDLHVLTDGFLAHYIRHGISETRRGLPLVSEFEFPKLSGDPAKPVAIVVVHEASRSGAPILGWNIAIALRERYRVVLVSLKDGVLWEDFKANCDALIGPVSHVFNDPIESRAFGQALAAKYAPRFTIVNSVESRMVTEGLVTSGVPVVALVHEFAAYTKPTGTLQRLYELATEIVFPAEVVRQSSLDAYPILRVRSSRVLPQGQSRVPPKPRKPGSVQVNEAEKVIAALRPSPHEESFLVVGMGFFDWRKGVDLFLATATSIIKRYPDLPIRFVWVGHGYKVTDALDVSAYVSDQIVRSGVGDKFEIIDAVGDVDAVYRSADLLYLSSRLDPLPNVSIDAALQGLPIVCFAEASGMAEILQSNPQTARLVVPHLDIAEAAREIAELAHDRMLARALGDAVKQLGRARFDMTTYVHELERLGEAAIAVPEQAREHARALAACPELDISLFAGSATPANRRQSVINRYAATASNIDYSRLPMAEAYSRRILPGFHPYTYALEYPGYDRGLGGDPTAHYLTHGAPEGPWMHPVIDVSADDPALALGGSGGDAKLKPLRVMLHVHMHYMDDLDDLVARVNAQTTVFDVVVTTDSPSKVDRVKRAFRTAGKDVVCIQFQNHGRDILPFVEMLRRFADSYDVVGHLHGKKSRDTLNVGADFGSRWRAFLWDRLFDIQGTATARIFDAFQADEKLGLVFPEDPHLIGWEKNFSIGQSVARELGIDTPLPRTPEFPVGTMFWARTASLQPLLNLPAALIPAEPLPVDGTALHALERLIPVMAESKGFHYATTIRNGSYR